MICICSYLFLYLRRQRKLIDMSQIIQKRVKLDNGKTVIVDMPAKRDGKHPLEKMKGMMDGIKDLKPCG